MFDSLFSRNAKGIVKSSKKNAPDCQEHYAPDYKYTYVLLISLKDRPDNPYEFTVRSDDLYEDVWECYKKFYDWYMKEDTEKYQFDYQRGSRIFLREQITGINAYRTDHFVEV